MPKARFEIFWLSGVAAIAIGGFAVIHGLQFAGSDRLVCDPALAGTGLKLDRKSEPLSAIEECALKTGDVFRECEQCPPMVVLPSGKVLMGSPDGEQDRDMNRDTNEGPQRVVSFGTPFAMAKFETTVGDFRRFVEETGHRAAACATLEKGKEGQADDRSWHNPGYEQDAAHPVSCVNWRDASAYVQWLSARTKKMYRLPSEAEWEYGARATTSAHPSPRFSFGNDAQDMCRHGNVADDAARNGIEGASRWTVFPCDDGYAYTAPAGSFAANAFDLNDMHGNLWEWPADCYDDSNDSVPESGSARDGGACAYRALRGGSFSGDPHILRSGYRFKVNAGIRNATFGFRVARSVRH